MNEIYEYIEKICQVQVNINHKTTLNSAKYDGPKPKYVSGYMYLGKFYTAEEYKKLQNEENKNINRLQK